QQTWLPHHSNDNGYDRLVFTGSPVRVGDELWLYYSCWDGDHLVWNRDGTTFYKGRTRIARTARAVLRWDGFVGLNAESLGELVTKPLVPASSQLAVNAAATKGSVRVELQSEGGKPLHGYSLRDCQRLKGNDVSQ